VPFTDITRVIKLKRVECADMWYARVRKTYRLCSSQNFEESDSIGDPGVDERVDGC
jgi:hypothetical protein